MNKFLLFIFVSWASILGLRGQGRAANWHFGANASLRFSAVGIGSNQSAIVSPEGCASWSDFEGKTLFYTDGELIWNKNHQVMANGSGLHGGKSASQSALVLPNPSNRNQCYVFTTDEFNGSGGMSYHIIDLAALNGSGQVISKNNLLVQNASEKLTAVRASKANAYWILGHGAGNNAYYAYLLDENGLSAPTVTNIGSVHPTGSGSIGYMKFSPDGTFLASAVWSAQFVEIFRFNNATGQVFTDTNDCFYINFQNPYGLEFSPSGDRLYVSHANGVTQYNMSDFSNPTSFLNNAYGIQIAGKAYALQNAPDGKIYVAKEGNSLDVITNPDELGVACGYSNNSLSLSSGNRANRGLPNFLVDYFKKEKLNIKNACSEDSLQIRYNLELVDSIRWNIGNGLRVYQTKSSALKEVTRISGVFDAEAILFQDKLSDTLRFKVEVIASPVFTLGHDTTICLGEKIVLNAPLSADAYLWNNADTSPTITINKGGNYVLKITKNGCPFSDTIRVINKTFDLNLVKNKTEQNFCNNATEIRFSYKTPKALLRNSWFLNGQPLLQNKDSIAYQTKDTGTFLLVLEAYNSEGCAAYDSLTFFVFQPVKADFSVNATKQCVNENLFEFESKIQNTAAAKVIEFVFSDGFKTSNERFTRRFDVSGTNQVTFYTLSAEGCRDSLSKNLEVVAGPKAGFEVDRTIQCLKTNRFSITNKAQVGQSAIQEYLYHFGDGNWANFEQGNYEYTNFGNFEISQIVTDDNLCRDTFALQIRVNPSPVVDFATDKGASCVGKDTVQFFSHMSIDEGAIVSFLWNFDVSVESEAINPKFAFGKFGNYLAYLEAISDKGCAGWQLKTINANKKPEVAILTEKINVCEEENRFSFSNSQPQLDIQTLIWQIESNNIQSQQLENYHFQTPGTKQVVLIGITDKACTDTAFALVDVHPSPRVNMFGTGGSCGDKRADFEAAANIAWGEIQSLIWDMGDGTTIENTLDPKHEYAQGGLYDVTFTAISNENCPAKAQEQIEVSDLPVIDFDLENNCLGDARIKNQTINPDSIKFDWYFDDGSSIFNEQNPKYIFTRTGKHTIKVHSDWNQCKQITEKKFEIYPKPEVDMSFQRAGWSNGHTLYRFESNNKEENRLIWDIGGDRKTDVNRFIYPFTDTGLYSIGLTAINQFGCEAVLNKSLWVYPPFYLELPNTFTPNGDGLNDQFGPEVIEKHRRFQMTVRNTLGVIVYESKDAKKPWDGMVSGKTAMPGVYAYQIQVLDFDNIDREYKGTIMLMR